MRKSYETEYETDAALFRVCINYDFIPGSPAYTPRGEYAPTEPPEPAECDICEIGIWENDAWRRATALEHAILNDWAEEHLIDELIDNAAPHDDREYEAA